MIPFSVRHSGHLKGELKLSGDKSITHRAIIAGAISVGKTRINNPAVNLDSFHTTQAFRKLGIRIVQHSAKYITVFGNGLRGLRQAAGPVYVGDSGTTIRLLSGLLAGQAFDSTLTAGRSLSGRPMKRVIAPIRLMGGDISARHLKGSTELYPPLKIKGRALKGVVYKLPVASAQVKSAIILAALYAKNKTRIIEPIKTRDHTERMLKLFKADIKVSGKAITVKPAEELISPGSIVVPSDISSASFFIVAALLLPGSRIRIRSVSLNPTRTGFLRVLKRMGADITIYPSTLHPSFGEPRGDILVRSSRLKGTIVKKEEIPSLIDELPILMTAACFAQGKTRFIGVKELRVKETDRVNSLVANLKKMGAKIGVVRVRGKDETVLVHGSGALSGARVKSYGDHRTAMSLVVAGLAARGKTGIDDISCIEKSFPDFTRKLRHLLKKV
ncbi:MAG: 3-phosphoshikimate 1-carboxyvinyltransferase [Candidatus Omnitrophica bacterium]|nr:3-phosphoshikimate 1-carboxyvinyltransferase [Candidatus Omnitrophota bacterium]MDD5610044.1 3-phosphoshikimate 1-carboxyvinyltransferase [Candidatus Omnitrophota bacterium]